MQVQGRPRIEYLDADIINVVRLVKDHHTLLLQLAGHHVGHLCITASLTSPLQSHRLSGVPCMSGIVFSLLLMKSLAQRCMSADSAADMQHALVAPLQQLCCKPPGA